MWAYEEDFIPPAWAGPNAISDLPPRRNGNGSGYGGAPSNSGVGDAARTEALEVRASAPAYDLPPPIEDAPSFSEPAPAPSVSEPPARYEPASPPLRLVLNETADEDADQKRLATVFRLLQAQPGTDRVLLTIHTRDGDSIDLALPTAKVDAALSEQLVAAVGSVAPVG